MKNLTKTLILIPLVFLLAGCGQTQETKPRISNNQIAINLCIEKGGIPILEDTFWNLNRYRGCQFRDN